MKHFFVLLLSIVILAAAPLLVTAQTPDKSQKSERVRCCHEKGHDKGKCDKLHTKSECEKEGGRVVKDCKECK
jgi:hypothetical protein